MSSVDAARPKKKRAHEAYDDEADRRVKPKSSAPSDRAPSGGSGRQQQHADSRLHAPSGGKGGAGSNGGGGAGGGGGAKSAASKGAGGVKSSAISTSAAAADIDAIFGQLAPKKKEAQRKADAEAARAARAASAVSAAAQTEQAAKDALEAAGRKANRMRAPDSPVPLRFDAELGMPIFSVESLKIGQGKADTALCPFDCQCCF